MADAISMVARRKRRVLCGLAMGGSTAVAFAGVACHPNVQLLPLARTLIELGQANARVRQSVQPTTRANSSEAVALEQLSEAHERHVQSFMAVSVAMQHQSLATMTLGVGCFAASAVAYFLS
eukprot:TRINITY_DN6163_c0_g1_i1.p1 TRINITY_DN6163_c0_g1~~TRINITY_DN6163_c0_g1_i1.p1  ORF type:complete len:131 (-),score=21.04 TRINITY_DN6163_c0_g1_i1:103-468(-)